MDLAPYIEDLLYQHDCVILPTIGGFIVNYAPARVDPVEQQVLPPSKSVSFNAKLVSNDGLLTHHIAQKEHLSYKQAATRLEAATRDIELILLDKKVVYFPSIGKLYFNTDSKLEFLPDATNFLRDAYGLPSLSCAPILRSKDYLQQTAAPAVVQRSRAAASFWSPARLAAAAAVLLLLCSAPYFYSIIWGHPEPSATLAQADNTPPTNTKPNVTASVLPSFGQTPTNTTAKDTVAQAAVAPVEATTEEEPLALDGEDYIIVLGAFGKEQNAQRLAKRLAKDNYLPDVTLKNGLHRVGVQLNCTPEALIEHLVFLQDNYNKKAWVLE